MKYCNLFVVLMSILFYSFSFKVDEVEISGTRKIEKEAIFDKIKCKKGMIIDSKMVQDDIEAIYRMRYFDNIEAHHEIRDGKNYLLWILGERPIIKKIVFSGNSAISKDDLKEKLKIKEFSILDINAIKADILDLKKFYEEKGFYLAQVDYEIKDIDKENSELIFKIQEYEKIRVKKITILGNRVFADKTIKEVMKTQEESLFSAISEAGNFKDIDFDMDVERIKYFYRSKGYLQVNIGHPLITVSEDRRWLFISFRITEGPEFKVNRIVYEGDLIFTESQLQEKSALKEGEIYSEDTLRRDIQTLTEMYQDEGYAFVNVIRNLEITPGENKVDIRFSFEKGKIAYFGKVTVKGNSQTRDKVVRRELLVREGMKYSGTALRKSKEAVTRLGFFDTESVIFNTISVKNRDDLLDLEISVKERSTGEFRFGGGYSSASGAFLQASATKKNFRGLGQDLSVTLNWAKKAQEYKLEFIEPYLFDTTWTAGGDIYGRNDSSNREQSTKKKGFDLRVGHPIYDYTRLFVIYSFDHTRITINPVDGIYLNPFIRPELENGVASSLKLLVSYDRRNNRYDPSNGFFTSVSYQFTGVGGDKVWSESELDSRFYHTIIPDLVFRSRAMMSQLYEREGKEIPYDNKLTLGGPRDMRGFSYRGVGPKVEYDCRNFDGTLAKDKDGNSINRTYNPGGLFLVYGAVELEYPIVKEAQVRWVTFVDAGNVYERYMGKYGDYSLRYDWGFGVRWLSPIGPLRFEWGFPIDRKRGEDTTQFHFDIGNVF